MQFTCPVCEKDSGTSLVHPRCVKFLNDNQKIVLKKLWHKIVIESAGCSCEECGLSAAVDEGKLTGDHIKTQGSRPDLRYDVTNGRCVCLACHNKRHTGEIKRPKGAEGDHTKVRKVKKSAICDVKGCPIFASCSGRKPQRCWKHG
jgi:hypothetical protein